MNKQQEALKLALEALEVATTPLARDRQEVLRAQAAIREALAEESSGTEQPAQGCEFCSHPLYAGTKCKHCGRERPAQQQEPVALDVTVEGDAAKLLASMLEPVLDDEPTPIRLLVGKGHSGHGLYVAAAEYQEEGAALLVNTSPPASKPWVGLTDEEIHKMTVLMGINPEWKAEMEIVRSVVRNLEAKLREKNA